MLSSSSTLRSRTATSSQNSSLRFCADGGANRLYDAYVKPLQEGAEDRFLPDLIRGDLDSLRPDAQEYYISKNVVVQRDPDQDSTDLGKCVAALVEKENESGQKYQLVIVGGLSGRLDQTAHTIHALTRLAEERESTWAVGRESVACVLGTGKHELKVSHEEFGDTCAILPFGQPAHVTTKGQKWDLGPTAYMYPTSFSSGISSSNHLPPGQPRSTSSKAGLPRIMPFQIPPPLTIQLPDGTKPVVNPLAPPAFNIPTYSHRTIGRPKVSTRPRITSDTFIQPAAAKSTPSLILQAPSEEGGHESTWDSDSELDDLEHVATARISRARLSSIPAILDPATPSPAPRREPSIHSDSHSSYHSPSHRQSPSAPSYLADTGHANLGQIKVWKWKEEQATLPHYSRDSLARNVREEPRTALGEGPGGRKESESDRLKRLYLCPWEMLSPRSHRKKLDPTTTVTMSDPEKQCFDKPRCSVNIRRLFVIVGATLLLLLLVADLLVLNIMLLPPAFHHVSSSSISDGGAIARL
ncbi:hypothetical protein MNV49_002465 [Pseudohyphozyma bogoriensis]|nr:hypothetical protein MNV49_002465 [Pseudohyphozyma bogoriensis]